MGLKPQLAGSGARIDICGGPPGRLVTAAMQLTMVPAAERHCELVADFAPKRAVLGEAKMVWVGRGTSANETGLRHH
jgi:hypothetical protein